VSPLNIILAIMIQKQSLISNSREMMDVLKLQLFQRKSRGSLSSPSLSFLRCMAPSLAKLPWNHGRNTNERPFGTR